MSRTQKALRKVAQCNRSKDVTDTNESCGGVGRNGLLRGRGSHDWVQLVLRPLRPHLGRASEQIRCTRAENETREEEVHDGKHNQSSVDPPVRQFIEQYDAQHATNKKARKRGDRAKHAAVPDGQVFHDELSNVWR